MFENTEPEQKLTFKKSTFLKKIISMSKENNSHSFAGATN